jgi:hypothetical protein
MTTCDHQFLDLRVRDSRPKSASAIRLPIARFTHVGLLPIELADRRVLTENAIVQHAAVPLVFMSIGRWRPGGILKLNRDDVMALKLDRSAQCEQGDIVPLVVACPVNPIWSTLSTRTHIRSASHFSPGVVGRKISLTRSPG